MGERQFDRDGKGSIVTGAVPLVAHFVSCAYTVRRSGFRVDARPVDEDSVTDPGFRQLFSLISDKNQMLVLIVCSVWIVPWFLK